MIFIDSNVPTYLVGAPHPHKADARLLLERLVVRRERLVTDAEVLQEILHRYTALRRAGAVGPALDTLLRYVDAVLPVTGDDVLEARDTLGRHPALSARDALHVAIMRRHDVAVIASFDAALDVVPGITRLVR